MKQETEMLELLNEIFEKSAGVNDLSFERAMDFLDWMKDEGRPAIELLIAKAKEKEVAD